MVVLVVIAGCAKPDRDTFAEAEALEAQGKSEEAARMFDLACAFSPAGEKCASSDKRAAEARLKAADTAMSAGKFLAAERLATLAFSCLDGPTAQKAKDLLNSGDLLQGLAYERALARGTRQEIRAAMEPIAATKAPVAALATAWLGKERPPLLVAAVKAACGPAHEGSCSKAAAELRAAAIAGPENDEAIALAEAEERRIYPIRVNAEAFLKNFATVAEHDEMLMKCMTVDEGIGAVSPGSITADCLDQGITPRHSASPEQVEEQLQKHRVNATVWLRAMKSIGDSEIVAALEERKKKPKYEKIDVPKPAPAPKTTGGKK
jgi:hypothetical protein